MDRHVRWLRHTIVMRVLARLIVEGLIVGAAAVGLLLAIGTDRLSALPLALSATQLVIIARVASAPSVNPLNYRFLEHFIGRQLDFEVTRMNAASEDTNSHLVELGLAPIATLRNVGDVGGPAVDIYQTPDTLITASIAPEGGGPIFLSRLTDGRILVTHDALIAPHEDLVVNLRRRLGVAELLDRHRQVTRELSDIGVHASVAGFDVVADQQRIEQETFAQLGPVLGSFLAVGLRSNHHLLQVRLSEETVRQRTIRPRPHPASIRPFILESPAEEIDRQAA